MRKGLKKSEGLFIKILREAHETYRAKFIKGLNSGLEKYFNKETARRVMGALSRGRLEIKNPESFNSMNFKEGDPSIEIYHEVKTFPEFFFKIMDYFKEMQTYGFREIQVRELLFVLADMLSKEDKLITKEILRPYIYSLVSLFSEYQNSSVFEIQILDTYLKAKYEEAIGLNLSNYAVVIGVLFEAIEEQRQYLTKANMPHVTLFLGVHEDTRIIQKTMLVDTFLTTMDRISALTKNITNLSEDTPELRNVLEVLSAERGYENFDMDSVLLELKRLSGASRFNNFYLNRTITDNFRKYSVPRNRLDLFKIKTVFTNAELFLKNTVPCACEVRVNCKKLTLIWVGSLIGLAKIICLMKSIIIRRIESSQDEFHEHYFKITLNNFCFYNQDAIDKLKEKIKYIESITNKNFLLEVNYLPEEARKEVKVADPEYIRIISDIHTDINAKDKYTFNFGEDFVINCGDTSGNAVTSAQWLKTHVREGMTTMGNHLGYSPAFPELNGIQNVETYGSTIHEKNTKNMQSKVFYHYLKGSEIRYLSNNYMEYKGIIIIGSCLYTDFCLYGEDHREECMAYARKYMNDFRIPTLKEYVNYTKTEEGWQKRRLDREDIKIRTFSPHDHEYFFHYSINYIKEVLLEHRGKPIVVVTHHAPSPYSIGEQYKGDLLNAAFASNLNDLIVANPNIRIWAHGHMHQPFDYILGETRVICEPFGYHNENNFKLPYNYGKRIKIEDIKSGKSWKNLLKKEIKQGIVKVYEN